MKMNRQNKCRTLPGEIETIQYTRKKSSGKRQLTLDQFPVEEKHYALEGEACHCPDCQHHLKEIGAHCYRQELVFIPAQIKRVDHIQHAYKCEHCSQLKDQDVIIKSTVPKAPLNHSLGSASIIAHSIHLKYNLKVPNYRQEADWVKLSLPITRKELTHWQMKVSEQYFLPLYRRLTQELLSQTHLHADETPYRVIESKTNQTYYWVVASGKDAERGITLYHHDAKRSGQVIKELLGDYSGYVHCDMHAAYRQLENAKLVGCWAHVRRKFYEATPKQSKESLGAVGLDYCNQLFRLEEAWAELTPEERLVKRQSELRPVMEAFFDWCRTQEVLPGFKLGKAIQYALNYENTFKTVLEDGHLVLSNNLAERAIKNLVIGRKNWLFSKSFEGAQTNAVILTMVETAKRHGLDSEKYINYLLTHLPNEPIFEKNEVLEAYLPWSELVQRHCQLSIQ